MILAKEMLRVRDMVRSLEVDLSTASFKTIFDLLPEELVSKERFAAMILSVVRGHTNDEDVFWHRR